MPQRQEDPIVTSARREALVALCVWAVCLIYSVTYCYFFGYNRTETEIVFYFGFPSWVFWGLIVPWVICCILSIWFAFGFIQDADLGEDADEGVDL